MTLPKCSKCGFPVCSCAIPRAISERAKNLWEDLNPVIGNEQAWEIIQKALDEEGAEARVRAEIAEAKEKRVLDANDYLAHRVMASEAMLDWLL